MFTAYQALIENSNHMQKIHLIALGGSVMHQLALTLKAKGYDISGSDDEIFDPAKSALEKEGILPSKMGWDASKITKALDAVILGMHAKKDNPELCEAQRLGLPIFSFPEFVYEQSRDKHRLVIAGSHGKTTITSMVMHALKSGGYDIDYLVGANVAGFDTRVRLTEEASIIVIEGDEYPSSPLDLRPKFAHYHHHVGLISGIAWDHINVYPEYDTYVSQFDHFADSTPKGGYLVYFEEDSVVSIIGGKERKDVTPLEYETPKYEVRAGVTYLITPEGEFPMKIFGRHNLQNLAGAQQVCSCVGMRPRAFYEAMQSFTGASSRLQVLASENDVIVYKDFAHAPSKAKATVHAVKEQYPERALIAVLELHTFSSLDKNFIGQYEGSLMQADAAAVFYNPATARRKGREPMTTEEIAAAFKQENLQVFSDSEALATWIKSNKAARQQVLLMSSANFNGLPLESLAEEMVSV